MTKPKTYRERGEQPKRNRSIKIEDDLYVQFQTHAAKFGLGFSAWAINALMERMDQERFQYKLEQRMKKR